MAIIISYTDSEDSDWNEWKIIIKLNKNKISVTLKNTRILIKYWIYDIFHINEFFRPVKINSFKTDSFDFLGYNYSNFFVLYV